MNRTGILRGLCLSLLLAALSSPPGEAQPAFQVKDLNTVRSEGVLPWYTSRTSFAALEDVALFRASDGIHGIELWKSDGTQAGTRLVADLCPGICSSDPGGLTVANGSVFFLARSLKAYGLAGDELWKTDGTPAGTVRVKELFPGRAFGHGEILGEIDGLLILGVARADNRWELWRSDGTPEGTFLLTEIHTRSSDDPFVPLTRFGGKLYLAVESFDYGREIWTTDGTAEGTGLLKDIAPGTTDGVGTSAGVAGGRVLFAGNGPEGSELWATDSTEAGTALLMDLLPGPESSYPGPMWSQFGQVFFFATDTFGRRNPWRSDGTLAGTRLSLPPASLSSPTSTRLDLGSANGFFFYLEWEGAEGWQLWATDGTEGGARKLQINGQQSGIVLDDRGRIEGPRAFFDLDGTLLFQGDDGSTGAELWRSDGTAAGTSLVLDLGSGSSYPSELTRAGDTVFFRSGSASLMNRLWKTDGTPQGTRLLTEFESYHNHETFSLRELTAVGDLLLFAGGDYPWQLRKSDGTPAGTTLVAMLPPNVFPHYVEGSILSRGDLAFFQGMTETWQQELWKSDGTEAGTESLGAPLPPTRGLLKDFSALRGETLLFAGLDSEHGEELWQSDGTEAGTFLLAETVAGPDSQPLGPFATTGLTVFFAAGGDELWKNDAGGTSLVRALPGNPSFGIRSLTAVGNRVYFSYDDGTNGRELWMSDGTEEGTRMVEDLVPGPGSSHPRELQAQGSILVFSATDGVHGVELWRSDGTKLGTRMLQDVAPGELPSSPTEFTASGSNLYFAATDGTTGFELWALPRTALLSTFADVPADSWPWTFIEALAASGLTAGCEADRYCPSQAVTRAQAAVFLMAGLALTRPAPPPGTAVSFEDVPPSHWAWSSITQFAAEGYTSGCSPNRYCPEAPTSRAELAVFLLRVKHGADYVPPPATGTLFEDVPADYWTAAWIEQLATEGLTAGCAPHRFCPGQAVTRAEMAVFLARTFELAVP